MNGRWDRPDIPHLGWTWVDTEDLGEPEHTCEMCGQEEIRYVHEVWHPDYGTLFVGCVCTEHMTGDYLRPKRAERRLKNLANRRAKWVEQPWRISAGGNEYRNVKGLNVGVCPDRFRPGQWRWRIDSEFSRDPYLGSGEAKLALFDAMTLQRK